MSINPVQGIAGTSEAQLAAANSRPAAPVGENSGQPDPGTAPSQEARIPQKTSEPQELPQDEVQVQRDNEVNDEIVIKYVDHSGNLILQMPSSEVLGLTRAIGEDFQEQAKARAASGTETGGEGGKTHGH